MGKRRGGIIDRALANEDWCFKFPDVAVYHLPKVLSDHNHVLINLIPFQQNTCTKLFLFEHMLAMHNDFEGLVQNSWN